MRNEKLRARREAMRSPSVPGRPMSRSELAVLVNEYIRARTGRFGGLRTKDIGRYERGEVFWPSVRYREAFRSVLRAASDAELGFVRTPRGNTPSASAPTAGQNKGRVQARPAVQRLVDQLAVHALIRTGDQLAVVRRDADAPWTLPGGLVRPDMPVQSSLVDYIAEQAGLTARIIGFAGGVEQHHRTGDDVQYAVNLVFEAQALSSREDNRHLQWLEVDHLVHHDVQPVPLRDALMEGIDGPFWRVWTV